MIGSNFTSWLKGSRKHTRAVRRDARKRQLIRPRLTALEDRWVPSTWTIDIGAQDHQWQRYRTPRWHSFHGVRDRWQHRRDFLHPGQPGGPGEHDGDCHG